MTMARADDTLREPSGAETLRETAPGMTLRESPDPVTQRDSAVGATLREPAAAPTVREPADGATFRERDDAQTLREAGASTETLREDPSEVAHGNQARPRFNLPSQVEREYEWVRDLHMGGGEADACIIRDRDSGQERFFKFYRLDFAPDAGVLDEVMDNDEALRYVVQVLDYSPERNSAWEIQEYCALGTLERGQWAQSHPRPFPADLVRDVLEQVAESISYLHGLEIVHRDIKPSNILVRTEDPLDLVLTDFGIARGDVNNTVKATGFAATELYAAPESYEKVVSRKSDWFSLGAIVYELLEGEPLLTDRGNANPTQKEAERNCLKGAYGRKVEAIADERWQLLLKGLTNYDSNYRWGYAEVKRWIDGENPAVHWAGGPSGAWASSPEDAYQPSWSLETIVAPEQLAASIANHWDDAASALAGRERGRLIEFLEAQPGTKDIVAILNGPTTMQRKLLELQCALDPKTTPKYQGIPLDEDTLKQQIEKVEDGDIDAGWWLLDIVSNEALVAYGSHLKNGVVKEAGRRLKEWYDQAQEVKRRVPAKQKSLADAAFIVALPELFELAYSQKEK